MVSIVSGSGLGLLNSSAGVLGNAGQQGAAQSGKYGDNVYVNAATGNLVLQHQDDYLASTGFGLAVNRTYNSLGILDDDNGDNWRLSLSRQVTGLTGDANTAGSTVIRTAGDGSISTYRYESARSLYVSTDGGGAFDTLQYDDAVSQWIWQSGSSSQSEIYDASLGGRIRSMIDLDGNQLSFGYDGEGLLAQVTDATGGGTFFTYDASATRNLTGVEIKYRSEPTAGTPNPALVSVKNVVYKYDTQNRLDRVETTIGNSGAPVTTMRDLTSMGTRLDPSVIRGDRMAPESTATPNVVNRTAEPISGPFVLEVWGVDGNGIVQNADRFENGVYYFNSYQASLQPNDMLAFFVQFGRNPPHPTTYQYKISAVVTAPAAETYWTKYTYDGNSRRVATIEQKDGNKLSITYETGTHRVKSISDRLHELESFKYDGAYVQVEDGLGNTRTFTTNADGTLAAVSYGNGQSALTTFFEYDSSGNVSRVVDPSGQETVKLYDANGNCVEERDAAGNVVSRTYSAQNKLLTETRYTGVDLDGDGPELPGGAMTSYFVYDEAEHLRFEIAGNGEVRESRFDAQGLKSAEIKYTQNLYNAQGAGAGHPNLYDLTSWVNAIGDKSRVERTDYEYDIRGLLDKSTKYAERNADGSVKAGSAVSIQRYVYDQAGRILQSMDGDGSVNSYAYDGMGRLLATTDALQNQIKTVYTDVPVMATVGGVAQIVTTQAVSFANGRTTTTTFDASGRILQIEDTVDGVPRRGV